MKKQVFKTVDLLIVVMMVAVLGGVISNIVQKNMQSSPNERVLRMAENISSQLLDLKPQSKKKMSSKIMQRGIASKKTGKKERGAQWGPEGTIGEDPWGSQFYYRFIEGPNGQWSYLLVWSPGPDKRLELSPMNWGYEMAAKRLGSMVLGDDVGIVSRISR